LKTEAFIRDLGDLIRGRPWRTSALRGGGGCPVRTFFGQGGWGSSDADVRTFCCKRLRIFWNLWYVRTQGGEEVKPVRARGKGVNFAILCGRHIWTASYLL